MNRRNFLHAIGATLAAIVTRRWPVLKLPRPTAEQTLYVEWERGNDDNDGLTPDRPKATIRAALDQLGGGDTVYVFGGYYDESLDLNKDDITLIGGYP